MIHVCVSCRYTCRSDWRPTSLMDTSAPGLSLSWESLVQQKHIPAQRRFRKIRGGVDPNRVACGVTWSLENTNRYQRNRAWSRELLSLKTTATPLCVSLSLSDSTDLSVIELLSGSIVPPAVLSKLLQDHVWGAAAVWDHVHFSD